jgi:hypothetical protein
MEQSCLEEINMGLPNDSVLVTPGSGATIATHLVSSKEYQVIMQAGSDGQIIGSKDTYVYNIPSQVHVAVANTIHWDLFNADAALLVRVMSIRHIPDMVTAVATGVAFAWKLARTTAVGTGGSALTAWLPDTSQTALDADITARSKPTGGATEGTILKNYGLHGEETNTGTVVCASLGGLQLVPNGLSTSNNERGILLRQNQGLRCVQITNSALGYSGWEIVITVE